MVQYRVAKMAQPDWNVIPAVELTHTGWLKECPIGAKAQLCHDGENIYVRLEAREQNIRTQEHGTLANVCRDSCLEFFFAPDPEDDRYFNFEFNSEGSFYFGFGKGKGTRLRTVFKDGEKFRIRPFTTETGWGITFMVPGDYVRMFFPKAKLEGTAAGNFYKCGDETQVPHYLSWSPMEKNQVNFHLRHCFGQLVYDN